MRLNVWRARGGGCVCMLLYTDYANKELSLSRSQPA